MMMKLLRFALLFGLAAAPALGQTIAPPAANFLINSGSTQINLGYGIGNDIILTNPLTPSAAHDARTNISLGFNSLISFAPISTSEYMTCLGFETCSSLTSADHITAVGVWALASITDNTTSHNTALGIDGLRAMTSGQNNVAVGEHAIALATTSNSSTAVGLNSLFNAGTATNSVAVGTSALQGNVAGGWTSGGDTAVGYQSMFAANGTSNNTAVGYQTLLAVTTGTTNLAAGYQALPNVTTGTFNVGIGSTAGTNVTTGSNNVFIGPSSVGVAAGTASAVCIGLSAKCGTSDVAIGSNVQHAISSTNAANTVVGNFALFADTTGAANVALGNLAGSTITTGSNNLVLGPNVGKTTLTTGSSNILIGTSASVDTPTNSTSNFLSIGGVITATGTGTPSTSATTVAGTLTVAGITADTGQTDATVCEDTTNHKLFSGTGTLGVCLGTSSLRYKRDWRLTPDGLTQVMALKAGNYFYKPGHGDSGAREQYGFLAEDVAHVLPKLVANDNQGHPNSVDILGMVPVMVKAMQQQQVEIVELRSQVRRLRSNHR